MRERVMLLHPIVGAKAAFRSVGVPVPATAEAGVRRCRDLGAAAN